MRHATVLVLLAAGALTACSPSDPEAEVRAFLDEAVAAVESGRTGFFRQHVSDAYADAAGRTRDDVLGIVRGYFLVNREIEVVYRVAGIEFSGEDFATVVLQAALIGSRDRPGPVDFDADLRRFDVDLARDGGDWQVVRAQWER